MTVASKRTTYTPDQINKLLTAWGAWDGVHNARAAMHLLTFTELARHPDIASCLNIRVVRDPDRQKSTRVASVANWDKLLELADTSSERQLVQLAKALVTHQPINLPEVLAGLGHATPGRVLEAMLMATGYAGWYQITPGGPARTRHERLSANLDQPAGSTPPPTSAQFTAYGLLETNDHAKKYVVSKALEAYGIAAHYDTGEHPQLADSEPLRAMLDTAARAAVAIALTILSAPNGPVPNMPAAVAETLTGLAVDLDLLAVELHDGA